MAEWLRRSFKEGVAVMAPIPPRAQELLPRKPTKDTEWELSLEATGLKMQLAAKEVSECPSEVEQSMNDHPVC